MKTNKLLLTLCLILSLILITTSIVSAQPPGEETILNFDHTIGVQWGPLGVSYLFDTYYQYHFFPDTDDVLFKDAHIGVGLSMDLSPAYAIYGPTLTIAPLTIFRVEVGFNHMISGLFGDNYGWLDYSALGQFYDYTYFTNSETSQEVGEWESKVWVLTIKPTLLLKFGPVILVASANFLLQQFTEKDGMYYDYYTQAVKSNESWVILNDTMVLYEFWGPEEDGSALRFGISSKMIHVLDDGDYSPIVDSFTWKIGLMAAWTISDEWFGYYFENPTLLVQVHGYAFTPMLDASEYVNAVLAFRFSTDITYKPDEE